MDANIHIGEIMTTFKRKRGDEAPSFFLFIKEKDIKGFKSKLNLCALYLKAYCKEVSLCSFCFEWLNSLFNMRLNKGYI